MRTKLNEFISQVSKWLDEPEDVAIEFIIGVMRHSLVEYDNLDIDARKNAYRVSQG